MVAVVTRPDAPAGRGRHLAESPVKQLAVEAGVEVLQPAKPREPEFLERLAALAPDCCPVVAYGALIPQAALDIPRHGWVNLHFSLLPAWRGAAPVQHAVIAGDEITGASTFQIEAGLDTGPVFGVVTEADPADRHLRRPADRLAELRRAAARRDPRRHRGRPARGAAAAGGRRQLRPQARARGRAGPLGRSRPSASTGWSGPPRRRPGAWTTFRGRAAEARPGPAARRRTLAPGSSLRRAALDRGGVRVGTATAAVLLGEVQPEGKPRMAADAWARGVRPDRGERLGGADAAGT